MYITDGDFGKVRLIKRPLNIHGNDNFEVPFFLEGAGWHRCNSLYKISRSTGINKQMVFFSLTDGGAFRIKNGSEVQIPASSALFLPPFQPHTYYTVPGKIWEFYWFDTNAHDNLDFSDLFTNNLIMSISNTKQISYEFEKMLNNKITSKQKFMIESSQMISNIYHILLCEKLCKSEIKKQDDLINDIIYNMKSDCGNEWSLPKLAEQYFISVPQLIRRFKAYTGMSPHMYLTNLRLETAEMLLHHTSDSVEEISKKVGFPCTSNFIRQFRNRYGTTPGKYINA